MTSELQFTDDGVNTTINTSLASRNTESSVDSSLSSDDDEPSVECAESIATTRSADHLSYVVSGDELLIKDTESCKGI